MGLGALTPEANQRTLQMRSDSPTWPARPYVDRVRRVSVGRSSCGHFHRGFFPGWLSSASSPSVLGTVKMTLSLVSLLPSLSPVLLLTCAHFDTRSVVISVGSPALAAYSLMLTALNARLVYRRAQRIEHGSKGAVARALVSLQQVPLGLTRDERLLAFMSTGDQWRQEILDRLNRRHAWSITTSSFVGWVAVIFIFNLVDSFVSLDGSTDDASEGHAASTLWLWLLCLVIGWSWVPTFTCGELRSAIGLANQKAAGKAAKWIKKGANRVVSDTRAGITRLPRRMTVLKGPRKDVTDPVPEVDKEYEKVKIESNQGDTRPAGQGARPKSDSFSNPSHNPSAVSFQLSPESHHGYDWHSASADPVRTQSIVSVARSAAGYSITQSSIRPDRDRLLISKDPSHSLNRDEFRLAATFNYSRVMGYLTLVDDVVSALNKLAHGKEEVGLSKNCLILEVVSMILTEEANIRVPYFSTHNCVPSGCVPFDV